MVGFVPNTLVSTFKQNICLGGRGGGGETEKERQKEKDERQTETEETNKEERERNTGETDRLTDRQTDRDRQRLRNKTQRVSLQLLRPDGLGLGFRLELSSRAGESALRVSAS